MKYNIMKKKILSLLALFIMMSGISFAQSDITGQVTDEKNYPLPGVTVLIKDTPTTGTMTDGNGMYTISAEEGNELVYSSIGYITKTIEVTQKQKINLQMIVDIYHLEDVVVVGYGSAKKSDLTGSVVSIKAAKLGNSKVGTVTSALQGLSTGVQVTQGSQKPGGDASVVIRGMGSLRAGNSPLFVVDGVPVDGGLQDLSPNDIASIEILKDASSSSIYGSRGSNGVILVTTKTGVKGQNRISFNASAGVQSMLNKYDLMDAQQYYDLVSLANPLTSWSSEELRLISRGETTDWQDAITQNGSYENYNLSVSGGNDDFQHFLGIDYYNQLGTIKNSSFDKLTVRYNMDATGSEKIKYGMRMNFIESNLYNINEERYSGYGTMFGAISAQPTAPVYTEDGEYFDGFLNTRANPVAMVDLLDKGTLKDRFVGSAYLEIEPIKNLKIRSDNGGELIFYRVNIFEDGRMGQHYTDGGHASIKSTKKSYIQSENTINYSLKSGQHKLKMLGGFSASRIFYQEATADSKDLSNITGYYNLGGAAEHGPNSSFAAGSTLASFYGRLNYNFAERYLATFTMRADGSSRFAPGQRWGYFPSLALAWRISEESFLKDKSQVDNLKLRISAGMLGNQNIGDYAYVSTISQGGEWGNYVLGDQLVIGSVQNTISNPNLTWEKAQQLDIGLDYGFFGNRIAGTLEGYYKRTNDLLWSVPLPMESGFDNSLTNIGVIENKGIEFAINTVNIDGSKLQWTSSFNISYNKNKIIELYDGKQDVNKSLFVGQPIDAIYTLKSDGIWQQSEAAEALVYNCEPGDRKVIDFKQDNIINGDDRDFAGNRTPLFFGSFTNTLKYDGFDLVVYLTYAGGHMVNNSLNGYLSSFNIQGNMSQDYYNNYWKIERPSNTYPKPNVGSPYSSGSGTDANYQKGDYLRVKNLEFGYTLPNSLSQHINASSIRLYASIQNLYTLTHYTGYDVESSDKTNPYPAARSFIGGISVNF